MIALHTPRQGFRNLLPQINIHPLTGLLLAILFLILSFPYWIYRLDQRAALPDLGIWSLVLLALAVFLIILLLCWYLFTKSWERLALPTAQFMVSQFKHLDLWQQFVLYWASFALLLLGAVGCLVAVL